MEITLRHIGGFGCHNSRIIQLTITNSGATITTDVTDLNHKVDESLIQNLRDIADELEDHNEKINQKKS